MFPSHRYIRSATPSLQWVPWPPLAGALRFPTFTGTMGFYDCSRSIRHPSGQPLEWRTAPTEEEIGSSLRFLGHPCGACPGLGTPASRPDLANNGRCQILPSARLTTSASPRQTISGLILTACFLPVYAYSKSRDRFRLGFEGVWKVCTATTCTLVAFLRSKHLI